jgi:DNA polymerase I
VHGFCHILFGLMVEELRDRTHMASIFDHSGATFRTKIYPAYKANRPAPPEALRPQFGLIREASRAFGIPAVEIQGYEADDIIATYTRQAVEVGARVTIVSTDKDMMPLLAEKGVEMLHWNLNYWKAEGAPKYIPFKAEHVRAKFGVHAAYLPHVLAIAGDLTDNIPGVPGIGIKGAASLVDRYGTLDAILGTPHLDMTPKKHDALRAHAEDARLSLKLVTLFDRVEGLPSLDELDRRIFDQQPALAFLAAHGLQEVSERVTRKCVEVEI